MTKKNEETSAPDADAVEEVEEETHPEAETFWVVDSQMPIEIWVSDDMSANEVVLTKVDREDQPNRYKTTWIAKQLGVDVETALIHIKNTPYLNRAPAPRVYE